MGKIFWEYWPTLVGLLGVLLLGAIGSALWDVVLRPSLSWTLRKFLSIVTLGIGQAKVNVYKKIAFGYEESFARFITYCLVMALSIGAMITVADYKYKVINKYTELRARCEASEKQIDTHENHKMDFERRKEELKDQARQILNDISKSERSATIIFVFLVLFLAIMVSIIWVHFAFLCYINSAIRYFNQLLRVCGPFIEDSERLKYLSNFALIDSPQAYKKLILDLQEVAKIHGCSVDGFAVWG